MTRLPLTAALGLALAAGCAAQDDGRRTALGPDHPADPQAAAAPVTPRSTILALNAAASAPASQAAAGDYVCPMHPHVTSAKPGNCPECKMKLTQRSSATAPATRPTHDSHEHGGRP